MLRQFCIKAVHLKLIKVNKTIQLNISLIKKKVKVTEHCN